MSDPTVGRVDLSSPEVNTCRRCGGPSVRRDEHTVERIRTYTYTCAKGHVWLRKYKWVSRGIWQEV